MKVLVTGSSGFLGKHLIAKFKELKIPFIPYYKPTLGDLKSEYFGFVLRNANVTHIVHLAAKVGGIGANLVQPYDFIYDNLKMGLNIIDYALKRKVQKFIMIGTVCSYPSNTPIPFKEESLWDGYPEATNAPYGIAKRTLHEVLNCAYKSHNLNSTTLNLANMYGPGDCDDLLTSHVIPAIIKKVKEAKEKGSNELCLWGNGEPSRDFLYVTDAVDAIVKTLDTPKGPNNGINIGTGVETKIKDVVDKICKKMNFSPSQIIWNQQMPSGQQRRVLDCTLAEELLGWKHQINLEEGLERII